MYNLGRLAHGCDHVYSRCQIARAPSQLRVAIGLDGLDKAAGQIPNLNRLYCRANFNG